LKVTFRAVRKQVARITFRPLCLTEVAPGTDMTGGWVGDARGERGGCSSPARSKYLDCKMLRLGSLNLEYCTK